MTTMSTSSSQQAQKQPRHQQKERKCRRRGKRLPKSGHHTVRWNVIVRGSEGEWGGVRGGGEMSWKTSSLVPTLSVGPGARNWKSAVTNYNGNNQCSFKLSDSRWHLHVPSEWAKVERKQHKQWFLSLLNTLVSLFGKINLMQPLW